jgi:hypothetical protein
MVGDVLKGINVNSTKHLLNRRFEIGDLLYSIRAGDVISVDYERNGVSSTTTTYTVQISDIKAIE